MKQLRYWVLSAAGLWFYAQVQAQTGELMLQRGDGGPYLTHQVAPKENYYSIGRLFNINPKVIAPFNGLDLNGGLSIGQVIKVPLKDQNFTSVKKSAPGEVQVPLYRTDNGKKAIAGYLKVLKGQSALASSLPQPAPVVIVKTAPTKTQTPLTKTQTPPPPPPTVAPPATPTPPPETTPTPTAIYASNTGGRYAGEGAFHPDYLTQTDNGRKIRSSNGLAGVFKSTSGWDNGKYYALMNNVERGTVVKVTNLSNNRIVFAKVLGDIAAVKGNTGMMIVLSDAAVGQLGASTDRFTAVVSYSK
jgi:LysM repeat protein